jgi:thiol:disulfide interchange protein
MSREFGFSLVFLGACLAVIVYSWSHRVPSAASGGQELIPWTTDYQAAQTESRRTGKMILLDFYADWCPPCRRMKSQTWTNPRVAELMKDYIPVQVNVDKNRELAYQFGIRGIPHLVIMTPAGEIFKTATGGMDPDTFIEWLPPVPHQTAGAATVQ